MADAVNPPLVASLWPARGHSRFAGKAALAFGGALALALSARILPVFAGALVAVARGAAERWDNA